MLRKLLIGVLIFLISLIIFKCLISLLIFLVKNRFDFFKNNSFICLLKMTDNEVIIPKLIPVGEILIKQCMQTMLRDTCHKFHIEEPFYTLHNTKDDVDGKRYYRCRLYCITSA